MKIFIGEQAREDLAYWNRRDQTKTQRIRALLEDIMRTPFAGIGKPESLKHDLSGKWSRRIDREHRLVYEVTEDAVVVISCRFHYGRTNDDGEQLVNVVDTEWFKRVSAEMTPGDHLRIRRLNAGLTYEEVARKIGTETETVSAMERGEIPIDQAMADRLAQVLGCLPQQILGR